MAGEYAQEFTHFRTCIKFNNPNMIVKNLLIASILQTPQSLRDSSPATGAPQKGDNNDEED